MYTTTISVAALHLLCLCDYHNSYRERRERDQLTWGADIVCVLEWGVRAAIKLTTSTSFTTVVDRFETPTALCDINMIVQISTGYG